MSDATSIYHGEFGRVGVYRLDRQMALHAHRESHVIFHLSGAPGGAVVEDQTYDLRQNAGLVVNPFELHNFVPVNRGDPSVLLVLYLSPSWLLAKSRCTLRTLRFGGHQIAVTPRLRRQVGKVAGMLGKGGNLSRMEAELYDIYLQCFQQSWGEVSWKDKAFENLTRTAGKRILLSLDHLKDERIDMSVLAREVGLSRPHFFALFKEEIGISPNAYASTLKIEQAVHDLVTTDKSLETIASDLQFSTSSSFSRFFSTNVGVPPSVYRRVGRLRS